MLKVILATALVAQAGAKSKLSDMLYHSVEPCVAACVFRHTISHDFRTLLLLVVRVGSFWGRFVADTELRPFTTSLLMI